MRLCDKFHRICNYFLHILFVTGCARPNPYRRAKSKIALSRSVVQVSVCVSFQRNKAAGWCAVQVNMDSGKKKKDITAVSEPGYLCRPCQRWIYIPSPLLQRPACRLRTGRRYFFASKIIPLIDFFSYQYAEARLRAEPGSF